MWCSVKPTMTVRDCFGECCFPSAAAAYSAIICSNARRVAVQSFNFVDGDLVESFLDLKHEHQKKVLQNIHGMAETKVPLANSEDTKEEDCDGNNIEGVCSWKAITQLTVEGLTQAIESIARQH